MQNQYKICVYAICKNEEQFVDRWMDSMSEADLVVVTDTGSTDGTVEKLRERGAVVFQEVIKPWRFDKARNISLDHVPEDVDICICTDLDEVLEPGWRKCLEAVWEKDTDMGNYLYNWSLDAQGRPYVQIVYFKVHARKKYIWDYPVHECLRYLGTTKEKKVFVADMVLNHYPDHKKSRGSYIGLLEMGTAERPDDPRMSYYLGREYMFKRDWDACISELQRYLGLPAARWAEERCAAMRWIAKAYAEKKKFTEAFQWFHRAVAEVPQMRDAYVECANLAYVRSDWETCFYMTEKALKIKEKSRSFTNAGHAWDYTPHDLAAIACFRLGMYERAEKHAEEAVRMAPEKERLKDNLSKIRDKKRETVNQILLAEFDKRPEEVERFYRTKR